MFFIKRKLVARISRPKPIFFGNYLFLTYLCIAFYLIKFTSSCSQHAELQKMNTAQTKNIFLLGNSTEIIKDSIRHAYTEIGKMSLSEFHYRSKELIAKEQYDGSYFLVYLLKIEDIIIQKDTIKQQIICIINETLELDKDTVLIIFPSYFSCSNPDLPCHREESSKWLGFFQKYDSLIYINFFSKPIYFAAEMHKKRPLRRALYNAEIAQIDEIADSLLLVQIANHGGELNCGDCYYEPQGRAIFIYHKRTKSFSFLPSYEPRFFRSERIKDYTKQGVMQVLALDSVYVDGDKAYEVLRLFNITLVKGQQLVLEPLPWNLHLYVNIHFDTKSHLQHHAYFMPDRPFFCFDRNSPIEGLATCRIDFVRSTWFETLDIDMPLSKNDSILSSYFPYPAYIQGN